MNNNAPLWAGSYVPPSCFVSTAYSAFGISHEKRFFDRIVRSRNKNQYLDAWKSVDVPAGIVETVCQIAKEYVPWSGHFFFPTDDLAVVFKDYGAEMGGVVSKSVLEDRFSFDKKMMSEGKMSDLVRSIVQNRKPSESGLE